MNDKKDKALKLALELALDVRANANVRLAAKAIALTGVIDSALAEKTAQQQEPVGRWMGDCIEWTENPYKFRKGQLLYTSPPASKPWVGLAEEDKLAIRRLAWETPEMLIDNTEAKLREKNT